MSSLKKLACKGTLRQVLSEFIDWRQVSHIGILLDLVVEKYNTLRSKCLNAGIPGKQLFRHRHYHRYSTKSVLHQYSCTSGFWPRVRARALRAPVFLSSLQRKTGRCAMSARPPPCTSQLHWSFCQYFGVKFI
jgi:hypothetical protein